MASTVNASVLYRWKRGMVITIDHPSSGIPTAVRVESVNRRMCFAIVRLSEFARMMIRTEEGSRR